MTLLAVLLIVAICAAVFTGRAPQWLLLLCLLLILLGYGVR